MKILNSTINLPHMKLKSFVFSLVFSAMFCFSSPVKAQEGCCSAVNFNDFQTYCLAHLNPCGVGSTCTSAALNAAYGITGNWINFGCTVPANCSARGCGALPVEMTEFDVVFVEKGLLLLWTTATEADNAGFAIERSIDARNWDRVDFVEGNGSSLEFNQYEYLDESPTLGFNYYRLKQVDYNGTFSYSPMKVAIWQGSSDPNKMKLTILPNPAAEWMTVGLMAGMTIKEDIQFNIYNQSGALVRSIFRDKNEEIRISLDGLPSGYYVLNARQGKLQASARFVKKKN